VSVTPESIAISGNLFNNSSGTLHHVGPAGPIMVPNTNAAQSTTTEAVTHFQVMTDTALVFGCNIMGNNDLVDWLMN
jgi:hypothetical protein